MSYRNPSEFVALMIDAGESKISMANRDVLIRAIMAGGTLAIAVALAFTATVQTGLPIVGALVFPVGFCILNLMGFDLLTGVFALVPLSLIDKRKGVTLGRVFHNWGLVFIGNFIGALTIAFLVAVVWTMGFQKDPGAAAQAMVKATTSRVIGYADYGVAGWMTCLVKGILCNWMVSLGVVGAMLSTSVGGKVIAMWMPILIFFALGFEHAVVNMYLFPLGMIFGAEFTVGQWAFWNQLPTILGNLIGGLIFTGFSLYATHHKTAPPKSLDEPAVSQ
ncbi:formate/nitrite transporter family protein [Agaribacterium haliotis]|uniref:formate/nitrite transporter family protein n=1 Tax=Agaribacterium haliotis TaxID=2013869 RepID=UPI000BB54E4A|nr:formate/nitrite transporter family protein [Agaribacterium haliotis]